MAKLYSKKALATTKMLPKRETIDFILNYSKALKTLLDVLFFLYGVAPSVSSSYKLNPYGGLSVTMAFG